MIQWKTSFLKIISILFLSIFISSGILNGEVKKVFQTGKASYYSYEFNKRKTSSGAKFNPETLCAAHKTLPFGTKVKVTNLSNGDFVIVKIVDRGPFIKNRVLDLSLAAARKIDMIQSGTTRVSIEVI